MIIWRLVATTGLGLKRQCHEIFCFRFFHESLSPKPLKITKLISIFSENSQRYSQVKVKARQICYRINDTCGKVAAGINDIGGKFATGINDTGGKFFHQFCLCCCTGGKYATGVNDNGDKFSD
jgi:hypothetical protein